MIKSMTSKMTTNSQHQQLNLKNKNKNKVSKLEQEENHRYGDHMEGYQQGEGGGYWGKRYRK